MYWHKFKLRQLGKKIGQAIAAVIILFACNPKSALAQANVCLSSQQGGLSGTGVTPFISGEVGPNGVANRDAAISLDDSWRAAVSGLTGFNNFQTRIDPGPDTNIASPFQLLSTASGANVDVFVSSLDMTDIDTCLGTVTSSAIQILDNTTLQDNAPRPNATVADPAPDLFDTAAQPRYWNQSGGSSASRNAVLFEFSSPVAAFGAWFGDLETRTIGGTPAILRLLDVNDVQIGQDQIIEPDPSFFTDQSECGGPTSGDITGCGNSTTRWIGFVDPLARVSKMIVIVGDDDFNDTGNTERISFIGATLANVSAIPISEDFGDAPDTAAGTGIGNYQTLSTDNGPSHQIVAGIQLGAAIDAETDGQPNPDATGDDIDNATNDDDGVQLNATTLQGQNVTQGDNITLNIATQGSGVLNAWIDWDGDGDFLDPGEQIATNAAENGAGDSDAATPGIQLAVSVPAGATVGNTFARFRYSSQTNLAPTGPANDGEVEDYQIAIAANPNLCPVTTYLIQNNPSEISIYNLATAQFGTATVISGLDAGVTANAVGFNILDGFLYALEDLNANREIYRIDPNTSTAVKLGQISALNSNRYNAGDVDLDGYYYVSANGRPTIEIIDINPARPATFLTRIARIPFGNSGVSGADLAINPVDGRLYTIQSNTGELRAYTIDIPTRSITSSTNFGVPTNVADGTPVNITAGAVFFDVDGNFYAYDNPSGNLWKFQTNPTVSTAAELVGTGQSVSNNDGARCALAQVVSTTPPPTISGTVFRGGVGIQNIIVELLDNSGAALATTTTAADGTYSFDASSLVNGNYTVRVFDPPLGQVQNLDPDGTLDSETLINFAGADIINLNFGYDNAPPPPIIACNAPLSRFDWGTGATEQDYPIGVVNTPQNYTVNGANVTVTVTGDPNLLVASPTPSPAVPDTPEDVARFLGLGISGGGIGNESLLFDVDSPQLTSINDTFPVVFEYTLDGPLTDVRFAIADIDTPGTNLESDPNERIDRVVVRGFAGAVEVSPILIPDNPAQATFSVSGNTATASTDNIGDGSSATENFGTLNVYFDQAIDRFTVTYSEAIGIYYGITTNTGTPRNPQTRAIAIGDILTCIVPPTIDLDGDDSSGATGNDFTNLFDPTVGTSIAAADNDVVITDDSTTITTATIVLTNRPDDTAESLSIDATAGGTVTGVTASAYDSTTGTLTLNGSATLAQYQSIISTLTYNNTSSSTAIDPSDRIINVQVTDSSNLLSNTATATIRINSEPLLLLVKRITAINGQTTTNGGDNLAIFNEDPADPNDNNPNWPDPNTNLIGGINGGQVQPGGEIEYTVYFLSTGGDPARNVRICDVIPPDTTFVTDSFNSTSGIGLALANTTIDPIPTAPNNLLTNTVNDGDRGDFYPQLSQTPDVCKDNPQAPPASQTPLIAANNTSGAVVVNVVNDPDSLPNALGPGNPANSYGFIRFKVRVK